ncbi:hypothetical protein PAXRUDRAFT_834797 [Paxillus rubicundulus Ve08.2h10]|uniref:DUF6534 domain-containing protein n=1 Tax=Paxillus rubicundulus Ve08.2h10 TaxID=930991 RepID=A0A0D0CRJ3_9AGAM|nr:hypothetical protein PAXRUDRAFT_834797 [Paxillus rubicundulus Ve08.2h10]
MFQSVSTSYSLLIRCRRNTSPSCVVYLPWGSVLGTLLLYWIAFLVQIFYAHRVWIISDRNRVITVMVVASAITQFLFGLMVVADGIRTPTVAALSFSRYTPWAAVASATCDAMITFSVFYYLQPARTGVARRGNVIKRLNTVFIQMGLLSFINAMSMMILYYIQSTDVGKILVVAPGMILSKTYVNSMLAVLNARKSIRDQEHATEISVPTIPTIY